MTSKLKNVFERSEFDRNVQNFNVGAKTFGLMTLPRLWAENHLANRQ